MIKRGKPVVLILVFIIIFSALALIAFVRWLPYMPGICISPPKGNAICERYGEDYLINITHMNHPEYLSNIIYLVVDTNTSKVVEDSNGKCCGEVYKIYEVDLRFQNEKGDLFGNISYHDNDENMSLSVGDTFVIRGENNAIYNFYGDRIQGIGKPGLTFILKFSPTNETIFQVEITDNLPTSNVPLNKYNTSFIVSYHDMNYSKLNVSTKDGAFSSHRAISGEMITLGVTVINNENITISNISIRFFIDGIQFGDIHHVIILPENRTRVLENYVFATVKEYTVSVEIINTESGKKVLGACALIECASKPVVP